MGALGTLPAQVEDVRVQDALVHQDDHGGNLQALQALASGSVGAAAVWRDHRDGMMGLYLRRLDAAGLGREPEQPIHAPHSGRRRDPAVALAADGSGAVAWTSVFNAQNTVFLRAFDGAGRFTCADVPLEAPADARKAEPGEKVRDSGDRQPALAVLADGRVVVAWNRNGSAVAQEFDAHGKPRGSARVLNPEATEKELAGPIRVLGFAKDALVLWSTRDGGRVFQGQLARRKPIQLCEGTLDAACTSPRGGTWIAVHAPTAPMELVVRDPDPEARDVERLPLAGTPVFVEFACNANGRALAVECAVDARAANARRRGAVAEGAPKLALFAGKDALAPVPLEEALGPGAASATDLRVVSTGTAFLIAWTDERDRDPNVFARAFDPAAPAGARFGPLQRLNSDAASADQTHGRVAASGERAIVVWQDARDVEERIFARRVNAEGFEGGEFELPLDETRDAPRRPVRQLPEVALAPEGAFAVAWRDLGEGVEALQVQLVGADGRPLAPHAAVDPGQRTTGPLPCSLAVLPEGRGYLLAWPRAGGSVWSRRVALDGAFASEPRKVGEAPDAETPNTSLCVLDDGRLVCAWDVQPNGRPSKPSLRARFLDRDGAPVGDELVFEPSIFGQDWDPCVAPAPKGGFVMAWCAGATNDPGRDVMARAFDAHGRPDGPFLPITTVSNEQDWPSLVRLDDGGWVVAWEDDLSGYDQTCVRRILPSKRELGPVRTLNQTETRSVPDRVLPAIAAWRGGFFGAWGDRRRSLGWDVYARAVGPRFDGARKH
ncbi:MAG: hypothetical protein HZA53_04155 [Planctomycetes bacterium]|nr:hypothetical protein [Planctomycetota bacterium]